MGRIGVIGGSKDYTGAPFYAADGALKFGADLSFVFCSNSASVPIKCYSPELMVTSFYDDATISGHNNSDQSVHSSAEEDEIRNAVAIVTNALPRMHSLVVGPGLGRDDNVLKAVSGIISSAKEQRKIIIIDADGLWLVAQKPSLIRGYSRCILTPNKVEFERLVDSAKHELSTLSWTANTLQTSLLTELNSDDQLVQTRAVSLALGGVTVLRKGEYDIISNGDVVYKLGVRGSPRRCGGQGDILAGCLGVALHWALMESESAHEKLSDFQLLSSVVKQDLPTEVELESLTDDFPEIEPNVQVMLGKTMIGAHLATSPHLRSTQHSRDRNSSILACLLSIAVVKEASARAYSKRGRSMTSPDVLAALGEGFEIATGQYSGRCSA